MHSIKNIKVLFARHADNQIAAGQTAYMKHRFEFYGIKAPERKALQKPFLIRKNLPPKKEAIRFVQQLWKEPQRELQYFAMELLQKYHRQFDREDIDLLEHLITHKSWWDSVDFLASNSVSQYVVAYPEERDAVVDRWLSSQNIWLQRSCLLFQLKYKGQLDTRKLEDVIHTLLGSKEFFINKAIGWILREYSKTNPSWVVHFVEETPLSPLSQREALKVINR